MPTKESEKTRLVRDYLSKFPTVASNTMATKIYNENKLKFTDKEHVRTVIRRLRGNNGRRDKKKLKDKTFVDIPIRKLPKSYGTKKEDYIYKLPIANNNILVISDLHVPYHNNEAISAALEYGKEQKVNTILINGDLIDFHQASRFEKDPNARNIKEEFDTARAMLEYIRHMFPDAKIVWLKGNHDVRYEHWLFNKAPMLFDDEYFHLSERLRLNELNIEILEDYMLIKAGKLFITHGHLMIRGVFAPVNAARGLYIRAKKSCLIGHTHSVSEHTEKDLSGELTSCWSAGCLCELTPKYDPHTNKHAHGFAHVTTERGGNFKVRNYRISNGVIL